MTVTFQAWPQAEFWNYVRGEIARWRRVVETAAIKID
jgi:hypothetical protein